MELSDGGKDFDGADVGGFGFYKLEVFV